MIINCIVVDDEPLARQGLAEYISEVPFLHLEGSFGNAMDAGNLLQEDRQQLLFLDIQMPRMSGLDFLRSLSHQPPVIFTTAYPEYALEGFELNALDYLVKPVSFERFYKSALRAREYFELRSRNVQLQQAMDAGYFFIKADNRLVRISFDEILYVEAVQNYVNIHTAARKFMTYLTFKSVEDFLPPALFVKIHKSYIVSVPKVESIEGNEVIIRGQRLPVSRGLKDEAMARILNDRFLRR
ncbi:MAG TPA: LytTR family DNA-binding domain-containing protein [Flavisolibacter sp.]